MAETQIAAFRSRWSQHIVHCGASGLGGIVKADDDDEVL